MVLVPVSAIGRFIVRWGKDLVSSYIWEYFHQQDSQLFFFFVGNFSWSWVWVSVTLRLPLTFLITHTAWDWTNYGFTGSVVRGVSKSITIPQNWPAEANIGKQLALLRLLRFIERVGLLVTAEDLRSTAYFECDVFSELEVMWSPGRICGGCHQGRTQDRLIALC